MTSELEKLYPEVDKFAKFMRRELWENRHKGDRGVWINIPPETWSSEIAWHLVKMMAAIKDSNYEKVREHAADIANGAMMCIDGLGLLEGQGGGSA